MTPTADDLRAEPATATPWWAPAADQVSGARAPAWVDTVDAALALAPQAPPSWQGADAAAWQSRTAEVVAPFVTVAVDRVVDAVPGGILTDAALRSVRDELSARLRQMVLRTLVHELEKARTHGTLPGETPAERFAAFVGSCGTATGSRRLLVHYPVLARLVADTVDRTAASTIELLTRLTADRAEISAALGAGTSLASVVDIQRLGDAHGGGRAVTRLRFADGTSVVYKPRPMKVHAAYGRLAGWLTDRTATRLRTAAVVVRDKYGWVEMVQPGPCTDLAGVRRFYSRLGTQLALLHALGAVDVHFENLLACADEPVVVDLETLLHPQHLDLRGPGSIAAERNPARVALDESVCRTAVLPLLMVGDLGTPDVSGVGGDAAEQGPEPVVGWADAGVDTMHLVRVPGHTRTAANRPWTPDDGPAEPVEFTETIVAGFLSGYDALRAGAAELTAPGGPLEEFRGARTRDIVRPTHVYAQLLDEATHPALLQHQGQRSEFLAHVHDHSADAPAVTALGDAELAQLDAGDIPVFTATADRLQLAAGGVAVEAFTSSGLDRAHRLLLAFNETDRKRQAWLVRATLATRRQPVRHDAPAPVTVDLPPLDDRPASSERFIAAATTLGAQIVDDAVVTADGRVGWLGLEPIDDTFWSVRPMGAGLPYGSTGIAVFLAHLSAATGDPAPRDLARRALSDIPSLIGAFERDAEAAAAAGCGYRGLGGLAYGVARFGLVTGDADPITTAARVLRVVARLEARGADARLTWNDGTAGALAAATALTDFVDGAEQLARACADRLADAIDRRELADGWASRSGFVDGAAGVASALLRYAEAVGSQRHLAAGRIALERAHAIASASPGAAGWCRGDAGLAFADAIAGLPVPGGSAPAPHDLSACHGESGVLEALFAMADHGDLYAAAELKRRATTLLHRLETGDLSLGAPGSVDTDDLALGRAGVGLTLLRLATPNDVPGFLALDSPVPTTTLPIHPSGGPISA